MEQPGIVQSNEMKNSVVVLTGELLREAEKLIDQKIHPMVILDGWRLASSVAEKALVASAVNHVVRV